MHPLEPVLVIGASLAGVRCAQELRRLGYAGPLTLVGAERHVPYDRPPLSKAVLDGSRSVAGLDLITAAELTEAGIDLRLGVSAVSLEPGAGRVTLDTGEELSFGSAVIATGSSPKRLPGFDRLPGVHYLRTRDDAESLARELRTGPSVVVVGGGFIGGEVASAARACGLPVTLVEGAAAPLAPVLGPQIGAAVARLYRRSGVQLRTQVAVTGLLGDQRVSGVELSTGERVPADLVVVGVGARPNTSWLDGSGLPLGDGIRCDDTCRVLGTDNIYAAGDVARWPHPYYGSLRVEHWTNAVEQAVLVASNLLSPGSPQRYQPVPYFWSDQFGTKIQCLGRISPHDDVAVIDGAMDGDGFLVAATHAGRPTGYVGFNRARALTRCRTTLAAAFRDAAAGHPQADGLAPLER